MVGSDYRVHYIDMLRYKIYYWECVCMCARMLCACEKEMPIKGENVIYVEVYQSSAE